MEDKENKKIEKRERNIIKNKKVLKKFLPIGTVVMLNGGTKRVMITGFCAVNGNDKSKIWDYSGCMYPEGFLSSNQTCLFDHSQIKEIYHLGLADDDEEREFKQKMDDFINLANNIAKQNNANKGNNK